MLIPSLRYAAPAGGRATPWAIDWRKRWITRVGSVHQHYQTGELVLFYSDEHDPTLRLALQAEFEATPDGVAQVMAAHLKSRGEFEASFCTPGRRVA